MKELATKAKGPGKVYFTGGATALLLGLREQTIDIDLKLEPEPAGVFEAIADLKNRLDLNIELASPDDFIPAPKDWQERSVPIASIGQLHYFHYDFTMQALAKLERGHDQDLQDVGRLMQHGHVTTDGIRRTFAEIEPAMIRYPAIEPTLFRQKVDLFLSAIESGDERKVL
jgi:hypothetical protein